MTDLRVLVEQSVWPGFRNAIASVGEAWTAPSGRVYVLELTGRRLEVSLRVEPMSPTPSGDDVDADLFALAGEIYDAVGGDWSSEALAQTAGAWGWSPGG